MTQLTFQVDETTNTTPAPQFVQDNSNQVIREYSVTVTERSAADFDTQTAAVTEQLTTLQNQDAGMNSSLTQNASAETALQAQLTQIATDKAAFLAQFPENS